jgi:hypothetical protein
MLPCRAHELLLQTQAGTESCCKLLQGHRQPETAVESPQGCCCKLLQTKEAQVATDGGAAAASLQSCYKTLLEATQAENCRKLLQDKIYTWLLNCLGLRRFFVAAM